jgi:hypothetical protein
MEAAPLQKDLLTSVATEMFRPIILSLREEIVRTLKMRNVAFLSRKKHLVRIGLPKMLRENGWKIAPIKEWCHLGATERQCAELIGANITRSILDEY